MRFEFATATRIIFGSGTAQEVAPLAAGMGKHAFVVTGRTIERARAFLERLSEQGIDYITFNVPGEPTTTLAKSAAESARQAKSSVVISIGGGSVIDTGKVVAAMLTNTGNLEDYLEVVGPNLPLSRMRHHTLQFPPQREQAPRLPATQCLACLNMGPK